MTAFRPLLRIDGLHSDALESESRVEPTASAGSPAGTPQVRASSIPLRFDYRRNALQLELPAPKRCGVSLDFHNDNLAQNGAASSDDGWSHSNSHAFACRGGTGLMTGAFASLEMFLERNPNDPYRSNRDPNAHRMDVAEFGLLRGRTQEIGGGRLSFTTELGVQLTGNFAVGLQDFVHIDVLGGDFAGAGLRGRDELPQQATNMTSPLVGFSTSYRHETSEFLTVGADAALSAAPLGLSRARGGLMAELHFAATTGPFVAAELGTQAALLSGPLHAFDGAPLHAQPSPYGVVEGGFRMGNQFRVSGGVKVNPQGTQAGLGGPEARAGFLSAQFSF